MDIFEISKVYSVVNKALDYRSLRQDLISSNISNISTPFYRPQDIHFETYLTKEASKIFSNEDKEAKLKLANTNERHLGAFDLDDKMANIFYRDGHMARNDGNSVDLDIETTELGKNGIMYSALVNSSKKHKGIFAYAIESGRNI